MSQPNPDTHVGGLQMHLPYDTVGPFYDGWLLCDVWESDEGKLAQMRSSSHLIGVVDHLGDGSVLYPTFQFTPELRVRAEIVLLAQLLCRAESEHWWTAAWFMSPHPELDDVSPVAWLDDTAQDFARLHALAELTGKSMLHP